MIESNLSVWITGGLYSEDHDVVDLFVKSDYQNFHLCDRVNKLITSWKSIDESLDPEDWIQNFKKRIVSTDKELSLAVGISALQLFVQVNWLGLSEVTSPLLSLLPNQVLTSVLLLNEGGESLAPCSKHSELLAVSQLLLVNCRQELSSDKLALFWSLRSCSILSEVHEEKCDSLQILLSNLVKEGVEIDWGQKNSLHALFLLESARYHNKFYQVRQADILISQAGLLVGLSLTETGAMGKRTQFQQRDIAQFTLDLMAGESEDNVVELDRSHLTKDVKLECEVRLAKIKFQDQTRSEVRNLNGIQQAVVVALFHSKLRSMPEDALTHEEILPYLEPLLCNPQCWSVHCTALLARSKLERSQGRAVERSFMQVESLVENIRLGGKVDRLNLVHSSYLPPLWEVEIQLGKLMISLGFTKAALELYLRLEEWEEVIACYTLLQMRHKAAEVIRARLEGGETVKLWCMLGDATDDLTCYQKALEMSNNKSARAFRSLGYHHYSRKEWDDCIPLYQSSLVQSSFQPVTLLRLGYAAMELEKWDIAAQAYRSYCTMEDTFEAWNNLARCYIKLGQKERAWRVLGESVRCDFENWKVWDNLMTVSMDVGVFEDVVRSYNRILDLKETHIDSEVLKILVKAVIDDLEDSAGVGAARLKDKTQKLLARLSVAMPREPLPWKLYGQLVAVNRDEEYLVRSAQYLQRSIAANTGIRGWEKSKDTCKDVMETGMELIDRIGEINSDVQKLQLSSSARLSLSSAVKLVESGQTILSTGELLEELVDLRDKFRLSLDHLVNRIALLKTG